MYLIHLSHLFFMSSTVHLSTYWSEMLDVYMHFIIYFLFILIIFMIIIIIDILLYTLLHRSLLADSHIDLKMDDTCINLLIGHIFDIYLIYIYFIFNMLAILFHLMLHIFYVISIPKINVIYQFYDHMNQIVINVVDFIMHYVMLIDIEYNIYHPIILNI